MNRKFLTSLIFAGVVLTAGIAEVRANEVNSLVKAHVAFVNAINFEFEPEVEVLKHQIIEKCAPAHIERLRNKAAIEAIDQTIKYLRTAAKAPVLTELLRKVAKLDEQGPIELQCLALLTIMREGYPETWKLIETLNRGSNPNALKGVERLIDEAK